MRPTGRIWILNVLSLTGIIGCGQAENEHFSVTPTQEFDSKLETLDPGRRCEAVQGYGCGQVGTAGSLVRGSFLFKEVFVDCKKTENGLQVKLLNSLSPNPTFQLVVNLYQVEQPVGEYVCKGPEFSQTLPQPILKPTYCSLNLHIHSTVLTSSNNNPCLFRFNKRSPVEGIIICPMLEQGTSYVSVDTQTRFSCAANAL